MVLALVRDIESVFEDDSPKIAELLKRLVAGMNYLHFMIECLVDITFFYFAA